MKIAVNPIECLGHGLCAEILPERIRLDEWGYPIVKDGEVPRELEALARRAADACPTLALALENERGARR
jgi:ferredoxin